MLKKLPNAWRCFTFDRNSPLGRFDIEAPYSSTRSSQSVSHLNTAQTQSCSTSLTGWNGCCEMKIILLVKINSICFSILLRLLDFTNQVPTARFSNQHFNRYFFRTSRFQIGSVFSETRPKLGSDAEKEKKWPRRKKISERKKMKVKFFFRNYFLKISNGWNSWKPIDRRSYRCLPLDLKLVMVIFFRGKTTFFSSRVFQLHFCLGSLRYFRSF